MTTLREDSLYTLHCRPRPTPEEQAVIDQALIAAALERVKTLRFPLAGQSYPDPEMDELVRKVAARSAK